MLGRLIQTAASYGKSSASLESATEEAHTRNLLYAQSQHVYSLAQSPPSSPFAGPTFRPGSFDDRGGLELEEKDLRLIIAQDAYGAEEKPTILFDSNGSTSTVQTSPSHIRHSSTAQAGSRAPLPADWKPAGSNSQSISQTDVPFRARSSTISSAPSAWTRQLRDTSTKEEALLECMFGVTSSTKATSTIKMHIIPGRSRPDPLASVRGGAVNESVDGPARRAPLARSRTSNISPRVQLPPLTPVDTDSASQDSVLITRLFHVPLPESAKLTDQNSVSSPIDAGSVRDDVSETSADTAIPKKPKLIERKVPAFAIGLILHLPRSSISRPASTRPVSRAAHGHNLSSASGSYGSDMQSSWSFLNAIPEALSSPGTTDTDTDRRIDAIVNNWEVILRAISTLEHEATNVIHYQLDKTLRQVASPSQKVPKEKSMQRINQRVISITNPASIAERVSLNRASRHAIRRICYALRVPRVVTGLGFAAGHWSDEARILYRICGRRQQNFFLFTLLTAFLGNHTEWLQRLAPEWYRQQFRATHKFRAEKQVLASRTIIVSDQRTIARHLLFVLASFLPVSSGMDGLQKVGEDLGPSGRFSTSSPSQLTRIESLRRTANRQLRDHRLQPSINDKSLLSTSASSTDSTTPYMARDRPHRYLVRKDSDTLSVKAPHGAAQPDTDPKKTVASTSSAISPNPATPVAYFSTKHDSYFPEGALAESRESVASADLAKILRRSSSSAGNSSNVSSRWGSLVSGISDLWSQKQLQMGEVGFNTPQTPGDAYMDQRAFHGGAARADRRSVGTKPAADGIKIPEANPLSLGAGNQSLRNDTVAFYPQSPPRQMISAPKLKVDDKDGVIDVDLDWPGFPAFSGESSLFSPTKRSHRPSVVAGADGSESVRSLRSIPTLSPKAPVAEETSVAGYLRRHHQDFAVHAVRPYTDLDEDIRRSMQMEASPITENGSQASETDRTDWAEVCTTLVADVRTFSIRRIVLRRKLRQQAPAAQEDTIRQLSQPAEVRARLIRRSTFSKMDEEVIEEEVKDFDVTLADAVERVLHLTDALHPSKPQSLHERHTRTLSTSTDRSTKATVPGAFGSNMLGVSQEYVKQDCRQVIIGALEDIVKDVNGDLDKHQKGRAIQEDRQGAVPSIQKDGKQDNLLREGVKKWLHEVDDLRLMT